MTDVMSYDELQNKKIPCGTCHWARGIQVDYVRNSAFSMEGGHIISCNGRSGPSTRTVNIPYFVHFSECDLYDAEEEK